MKYLFTTPGKPFGTLLLIAFLSLSLQAQKNTDSPYSRYGVGLLSAPRSNGNFGQGGVAYAWRPFQYKPLIYDSLARSNAQLNDRGTNYINLGNPASFSNISLTTFEAALISRNVQYTSGGQDRTGSNTQFSHMAVAFPVAEKWGVAFGIRPFSSVGYDYINSGSINGNDVSYHYEGSGGINEVFIGTAYQLGQNMSLGLSGKYLFGSILDDRRVVYTSGTNFFNTLDERDQRVSDVSFTAGIQYFRDWKKDYRVIAGAVVSPINELSARSSQLIRNYVGNIDLETFKDTSFYTNEKSTTIAIQPEYGVGFAFEKKMHWMISLDYTFQSALSTVYTDGVRVEDNHRLNLGFEKFNNLTSFGSYWKQMGYRAGLAYNSSLVNIDGEDISEFGISFGISMPLRKSFSTLNLGLELGRRGKDEKGLTQENFFNLQFGVTINDKWFIQRKYD
jgi:hypothetical protein